MLREYKDLQSIYEKYKTRASKATPSVPMEFGV